MPDINNIDVPGDWFEEGTIWIDAAGTQWALKLFVPSDINDLATISMSDLYNNAMVVNVQNPSSSMFAKQAFPVELAKLYTPQQVFAWSAYNAISNNAIDMGMPESYLDIGDITEYFAKQAAEIAKNPQSYKVVGGKRVDLQTIVDTARRYVDDPAFRIQMKAAGLFGEPSEADISAAQGGQVTGGGGGEPGLTGSPIKFAEELGQGIVTPTSATVIAKTREEAEKLGATWWIPDTPKLRESYATQKAELERLLSQGYSMEQTPDEAARGFAVGKVGEQNQMTAGGIPWLGGGVSIPQAPVEPIQVGPEPPSLTEQFSAPVVTQKRQEWESLKKKARSAQMASNKQWRVGL